MKSALRGQPLLILLGFLWFFLIGAAQSMNGPLGVRLAELGAVDRGLESSMALAFFAGSTLAIIAAGFLSGKLVTRLSAVLYVLGSACAWTFSNQTMFLVSLAVLGLGYGGVSVWFNGEFSRKYGIELPGLLLALNAFWAVGAVVGPQCINLFQAAPKQSYALLAGIGLVTIIPSFMLKIEPPHLNSQSLVGSDFTKRIALFGILMVIYVGTEVSIATLLGQYFKASQGFGAAKTAELASLLWLGFMLGRFVFSLISNHMTEPIRIGIAASGAALSLLAMPQAAWVPYAIFALGFCMGPIFPTVIQWAAAGREDAQKLTSALVTAACVAAALGPTVTSVLAPAGLLFGVWAGAYALLVVAAMTFPRLGFPSLSKKIK